MSNPMSISAAEYHAMKAATMTEAQLQATIIAAAGRYGWETYHTHDSRRSRAGYPDLTLWHPTQGRIMFRELKTQKGRPTEEQKHVLATLAAAGADAGIWRPMHWFDGTVRRELDEPAPDFAALATALGLELLPWQLQLLEHDYARNPSIWAPNERDLDRRLLQHYAALEHHPHRTTHPEGEPR